MKCPSCKLENPETALRCDCGYAFSLPAVQISNGREPSDPAVVNYLLSIDDSLRTIKRILVWWVWLGAICAFITLVIFMFRR